MVTQSSKPLVTSGTKDSCAVCDCDTLPACVVRYSHYQVLACSACSSWTLFPRLNAADQEGIHATEDYFDHPYFQDKLADESRAKYRCDLVFDQILELLPAQQFENAKILDVGCGTGSPLSAIKSKFSSYTMNLTGLDVNKFAVDATKARGLNAYLCPLESAPREVSGLTVITAIDLIEHLADPHAFLKQCYDRLSPGGVLYLETPNLRSIVFLAGSVLGRITGGRPHSVFERLFLPQHAEYFSQDGLSLAAQRAGLKVTKLFTRILPDDEIAASLPVKTAMSCLQSIDRLLSREIIMCAFLQKPSLQESI